MPKYLFQRTTLLGLAIILGALTGTYFGLLDEGTAICLITFGAGGLIPENCPMAHRLLEILAPLLVRGIKKKSP